MGGGPFTRRRLAPRLVLGAGGVLMAVVLFRVPVATVLFLGLALLCPVMMIGMHGGRGHRQHHADDAPGPAPSDQRPVKS